MPNTNVTIYVTSTPLTDFLDLNSSECSHININFSNCAACGQVSMTVTLASTTDVYYNLQISSVVSVNGSTYYALIGPIAINVTGLYTPTIVYSNALINNYTQVMNSSLVCLGRTTHAHTFHS
jgi:hypothetical protein